MDCISGLPLYELTTPANTPDSNVAAEILANANQTISLQNCSFIADKAPKTPKNSHPETRSVRQALPCTRTARRQIMVVPDKNTAVLSDSPKPDNVPAITETGITARKTEDVPNTKPFRMITDFLLTEAACRSNEPMLCGLSVNVIIHASNAPDRNASGFTTA